MAYQRSLIDSVQAQTVLCGMIGLLTHQGLKLFLLLIVMIFLNVAPMTLQRRDQQQNKFFFWPEVHFSGVAKNVYLGVSFDGSANCLFVLIFASILGMIDIYMHINKLYDLFPHPSHPEPSFPVSLLTYCRYIPLVLKTSCMNPSFQLLLQS